MYTIDNLSSLNFTINFECAFYSIMYIDKKKNIYNKKVKTIKILSYLFHILIYFIGNSVKMLSKSCKFYQVIFT